MGGAVELATNTEAALPRLSGLGGHTQAGAASSTQA